MRMKEFRPGGWCFWCSVDPSMYLATENKVSVELASIIMYEEYNG